MSTRAWRERATFFAIIGAGMAGILAAIKLKEAGLDDFTIYEKADRLGGTWRENTYPGIACDVPSHLYSYSFALNPDWSTPFSPGARDPGLLRAVSRESGDVQGHVRFGDEVVACRFEDGRWHLDDGGWAPGRGGRGHRRHRGAAPPQVPRHRGARRPSAARRSTAPVGTTASRSTGARVGIIGTGSTAVQIIIGHRRPGGESHLFQRTAQWVMPTANPAYHRGAAQTRSGRILRPVRRAPRRALGRSSTRFSDGVVDADSARLKHDRGGLPGQPRGQRRRPRAAGAPPARLPRRLQAPHRLARLLRGHPAAQCRARHRRTSSGVEPGGRAHRRRPAARARRARAGHRLQGRRRSCGRCGHPAGAAVDLDGPGPTARGLPVDLGPGVPEPLHAQRAQRPGGQLLAHPGGRAAVRLHPAAGRARSGAADCREVSPTPEAARPVRGGPGGGGQARPSGSTGCRSWYLDDRGVPAVWPWPFSRFREEMAGPSLEAYELAG